MTLAEYLRLLDWTDRQPHLGERDVISGNAPPIPERPGTSESVFSPLTVLGICRNVRSRLHPSFGLDFAQSRAVRSMPRADG